MTRYTTTKHLILVSLDVRPDTPAYRAGLEAGPHPFIATRYEDAGRPFVEAHPMTPHGDLVMFGHGFRHARPEMTDGDIDRNRDDAVGQIVEGVLGMTLAEFDEANGKFATPSGSTYMDSLAFEHPGIRAFALAPSVS